jgi:hypothetical protein
MRLLVLLMVMALFTTCKKHVENVLPHVFTNSPISDKAEWIVDTGKYSNFMTIVASPLLERSSFNHGSLLAAFSGKEIRGVCTSYWHNGRSQFNLIIYSNVENDTISFGLWIDSLNQGVMCSNRIAFSAGEHLGNGDLPFWLNID